MSIFKVNDLFYDCEYQNTRSGFNHVVKVKNKFGEVLAVKKTHYINRTWEAYDYQIAMMRAQDELKKQIKAAKAGRVFLNYRYEDWTEYDFKNQPRQAILS